jgi:aspartyl-tRNA(Asn)/glutamyl-tRNA(Gln) amidotransferase subunit C
MEITKEELLKLATLSALSLDEDEIPELRKHIQDVLAYAQRVQELAAKPIPSEISYKTVNRFRQDTPQVCDPEAILAQAPERAENFFVVPRILEG